MDGFAYDMAPPVVDAMPVVVRYTMSADTLWLIGIAIAVAIALLVPIAIEATIKTKKTRVG